MPRRWAEFLLVAYLMTFLGLTLGGFYYPGAPRNLVPFRTMEHDLREGGREFLVNFVGNVVVTLPIGWFLPFFLGKRCAFWKVGAVGLALSAKIETLQGYSGRRVADIDDVILNTLGGLVGYGLWKIADQVIRRRKAVNVGSAVRTVQSTMRHQ